MEDKEIKNHLMVKNFYLLTNLGTLNENKDLLNWYSSSSSIKNIRVKTKRTVLIMEKSYHGNYC